MTDIMIKSRDGDLYEYEFDDKPGILQITTAPKGRVRINVVWDNFIYKFDTMGSRREETETSTFSDEEDFREAFYREFQIYIPTKEEISCCFKAYTAAEMYIKAAESEEDRNHWRKISTSAAKECPDPPEWVPFDETPKDRAQKWADKTTGKSPADMHTSAIRRYNSKNTISASFTLPRDLVEEFRAKCKAEGQSQLAIIRAAMQEYLDK